jgi:acyl-CoA reductase-like NAD-dependent aldehyde dehydrogenase
LCPFSRSWVEAAAAGGARMLTGGRCKGAQFEPTLLVDVQPSMKVVCEEVFGAVVSVQRYDDLDRIFALVSDSPFGLQCGIFTASLETALQAARSLRTGGVIINGTSTWRTDQLPYGSVKDSGIGREGPRYAIRDMTEERLVVFNM